jgi:hypothetical protein
MIQRNCPLTEFSLSPSAILSGGLFSFPESPAREPRRALQHDFLDLIQGHLVIASVVELGRARALVRRRLVCVLQQAPLGR